MKMTELPNPGDRVEFISTTICLPTVSFTDKLQQGARGTVASVDEKGIIRILWDNGMRYSLYHGYDVFRILSKQEREDVGNGATETR